MKPTPRNQVLSFFMIAAYVLAGCGGTPFRPTVFVDASLDKTNGSTMGVVVDHHSHHQSNHCNGSNCDGGHD